MANKGSTAQSKTRVQSTTKVALITGGARRLGAAMAKHLHRKGYCVAIHYRSSKKQATQLADELNSLRPNSAYIIAGDLGPQNIAQEIAEKVINQFGRCDLLVNNASSYYSTPIGRISENQWDDLFSANAKAPLFITQALSQTLKSYKGSVINIADIHALRPLKSHTLYCMAKAANVMLTKSLALELAPDVRVNGIAPGAILWPEDDQGNPVKSAKIQKKIPLGTLGGEQAILNTLDYLLSADYVTGQVINVDGGRTLAQ